MKPLQIGLLVLVGALGGAVIMRFASRPRPAPAPITAAAPAPAPAAPVQADAVPAPVPQDAAEAKPAPFPESTPPVTKRAPAPKSAPAVRMTHHSRPMQPSSAPAEVAQNLPPAPPAPVAQPAPAPVQPQESAPPPVTTEPAPAPATAPAPAAEPAEPAAPEPAPSVTLQAGMTLPVRLGESLSSDHNQAGDGFTATLDAPLAADGFVIAEKGAHVEGRIVEAQKSGHGRKATLALELTKLDTSDGQHVAIRSEIWRKQGTSMATGDQVGIVAAAAGIGAVIGAIAGGGKGAAIGAGAGGAAGTGGVIATRDKAIALPTESKITFRLGSPVTITERLKR
ncbi:MAG TPA: hypothetical protein VMG35_16055 [Bryobacteraceae bacterium]|nr:hypothetical protein [Bryobacteraceae bacterium]